MCYRQIILPLCVAALICKHVPAQQPHFQEENFPSPASAIKHVAGIAADKNNCVWLATQTGIYRYDGTQFRHYSVLNTPALKFERMTNMALRMTKQGSSWCFRDTKYNLYEVDSFSRIREFSPRPGSEEQIIYEKYFYHLPDPQKNRIASALQDSIFETFIIPSSKRVFLLLLNGNIVSMTTTDFFNGGEGKLLYSLNTGYDYKLLYGNKTLATNKNFYVITPGGLGRWGDQSLQPQPVILSGEILSNDHKKIDYQKLFALKSTNPEIILFWYDGNIYEAFESGDSKVLNTRLLIKGTDKEPPASVFYSPVQQLFISYYLNKGLIIYRPRQFFLLKEEVSGTVPNGIDYYYSLINADSGFITVNDSGIVWLGIKGEQRTVINEECSRFFIFKDRDSNLWYQRKRNNSIFYQESGTGKSILVQQLEPHEGFTGVYQKDDSTFYVLTSRLFRKIVVRKAKIISTQILYTAPPEVDCSILYALTPHILWLGSDKGLIAFSINDNSFKKVAGIENVNVRAAIKLGENNYLLGTYDKGIFQFSNGKWTQLSSIEKEMPASAHAFIIDQKLSSLWVSSNTGILHLPLQQLLSNTGQKNNIAFRHFTNFGLDISSEFNGSSNMSAAKLSDTCFAFANASGLVVFNPLNLVSHPLPSNVLIETISGITNDLFLAGEINVNHIEFNPVVPYFGNRNDLEVLYRLTNSDEDWHKLPTNSNISYNNLEPGPHDLEFRIKNYGDTESEEVFTTAGSFYVAYRWYEKIWFQIAILVFGALVLVSLHYLRIWYIIKRRKELEQLVKMKTSELSEANDNLISVIDELSLSQANLKQSNSLKDDYYAVLTHDLRSPLKFLSFNISQLLQFSPDLKNEGLKKGLFAAHQCANDVYKLIDEFVYWIQDNENLLKIHPSPTIVSAIIEDARKIYEFNLEGNKNTFIADIPPDLVFTTDPKLLFIVMRNAIDNANKYTSGGTITVSASRQNGNLQILVSDTGHGISEEQVRLLTNLQYETVQLSYKQRKSLGFYIMAMLTKMLGGSYTISSTKGNGTSLCFTIPELKEEKPAP